MYEYTKKVGIIITWHAGNSKNTNEKLDIQYKHVKKEAKWRAGAIIPPSSGQTSIP